MNSDIGRLRWRCRRGLKELDVLLSRYLKDRYATASAAHQEAFRQLLESQDPLIYAYFLGQATPPDAALSSLIEQITASASNDRY
jgi:antitoxin CptB